MLDGIVPEYEREAHEVVVRAPADVVYRTVRDLTALEIRLLGPLIVELRIPSMLRGRRRTTDASARAIDLFVSGC